MQRGIVEGLPTSSLLLAIVLTSVFRRLERDPEFHANLLRLPGGYGVPELLVQPAGWVDDWLLFAPSVLSFQILIQRFSALLNNLGMSLALDKIGWFHNSAVPPTILMYIDGQPIHKSTTLRYLGAMISPRADVYVHLAYRECQLAAAWAPMRKSLRTKGLPKQTILKAFNSIAIPSILWAMESFPIVTNVLMTIHTMLLPHLRRIVGFQDSHVHEEWLRVHRHIRQLYCSELILSPAMCLYKRQEQLHNFILARESFDLSALMSWRSNSWVKGLSRRARPSRSRPGAPPKQLEVEFEDRELGSVDFRASRYAQRHSVAPFS